MRRFFFAVFFGTAAWFLAPDLLSQPFKTRFEQSPNETATYPETIDFYERLAKASPIVKVLTYGETDFGKPLHLVVVSKTKQFNPTRLREQGKVIMLVNNGIHPGEPDGVDASMMLVRDLALGNRSRNADPSMLDNAVLIVIPMFSPDGASNRNSFSRVNQQGPKEYGFRGNAQNLNLNRDFMKCDSKNARTFAKIFHEWQPHFFVDTHTTNGADYSYAMTLIDLHPVQTEPPLTNYLTEKLTPFLYDEMKARKVDMSPYVESLRSTPDSGIVRQPFSPRYSHAYVGLFNTLGFVSESHMLKTHAERVEAQYQFLTALLKKANEDSKVVIAAKKAADEHVQAKTTFELAWKMDASSYSTFLFSGYEAKYKPSAITGFNRLYYDRAAPYQKDIRVYDRATPAAVVQKPIAYVVPQAYAKAIETLKLNNVEMKRLSKDQTIEAESYYIESYQSAREPFEAHYVHSDVQLRKVKKTVRYFEGDYVVYVNQSRNNFIVHALEPEATDSFFNWNFFDAALQQKEGYSAYLFEETADSLLKSNPELAKRFAEKKQGDEKFRNSARAQLDFIYKNSPYYEPEFMRYPVGRIEMNQKIDAK